MDGSQTEGQQPQGSAPAAPQGAPTTGPQGQTDQQNQDHDSLEAARRESRKWEARAKKDAEALEKMREQVKGLVSPEQVQSKETALAEAAAQRDAALLEALKYRVALEAGLPVDLAQRLVGSDEAELKKDAAALKGMLRPTKGTPDMHAGTQPGQNEKKPDANAALRMALGYSA